MYSNIHKNLRRRVKKTMKREAVSTYPEQKVKFWKLIRIFGKFVYFLTFQRLAYLHILWETIDYINGQIKFNQITLWLRTLEQVLKAVSAVLKIHFCFVPRIGSSTSLSNFFCQRTKPFKASQLPTCWRVENEREMAFNF